MDIGDSDIGTSEDTKEEVLPPIDSSYAIRSGCVPYYAVLLIVVGLATLGNTQLVYSKYIISLVLGPLASNNPFCITIPLGTFTLLAGIGLWQMKRWGLIAVLILFSLLLIDTLITSYSDLSNLELISFSEVSNHILLPVLIAYALWWLLRNRDLFNGHEKVSTSQISTE